MKIKLTDSQKFDAFFHIINIVISICAIIFSLDAKNDVNTYKIMVQELNTTVTNLNSQIFNIKGDMNQEWNSTYIYEYEKSVISLLNEAEVFYDSKRYEEVLKVYSDERLRDNVIVLNNLGYMYANGYYVEQDFKVAERYYNEAIESGSIDAYNNKLSMYLKYCLDDIPNVITEGYDLGSKEAAAFVSEFSDSENENVKILYDFCNLFTREEQMSYIDKMYYWDEAGIVSTNKPLSSEKLIRYEVLSDSDIVNEEHNSAGFVFMYREYNLRCANIAILGEHFIKMIEE